MPEWLALVLFVGFVFLIWFAWKTGGTPILPPVPPPPNPPPSPPSPPPSPNPPSMPKFVLIRQTDAISDADVMAYVAAQQIQIDRDCAPHWGSSHVVVGTTPGTDPNNWPVYLLDNSDVQGALAYHDVDPGGRPFAKVFILTCREAGVPWQSACSHEILEAIGDPEVNSTVIGPNGRPWAEETGDPVEASEYDINGVPMSDFVFKEWFQVGFVGKVDQMGVLTHAYQIALDGYAQYQNPDGSWTEVQGPSARKWRK